jgi:hypothetical protein
MINLQMTRSAAVTLRKNVRAILTGEVMATEESSFGWSADDLTQLEELQVKLDNGLDEEDAQRRHDAVNADASTRCVHCGQEFSTENPCWNSYASYFDGRHVDGECKMCAGVMS